ncbi:MAG: copper homeostasis protein CutC [Saprospiraceae bacterium]
MDSNAIKIEICAASPFSAMAAQQGGADRIELCAALEIGGITPSFSSIEMCKKMLDIPVFVLIRPRGGDFCYSESEMQQMIRDIEICHSLGVGGIVSGSLNSDGSLHIKQLQKLQSACKGMEFTFHRAFDRCNDPFLVAAQLADLGVDRILSSGQQPNALKGASLLARLIEKMEGQIIFMPGSGINVDNIKEINRITGAREYHFSAKKTQHSPFAFKNDMKDKDDYSESDVDLIRSMVNLAKSF